MVSVVEGYFPRDVRFVLSHGRLRRTVDAARENGSANQTAQEPHRSEYASGVNFTPVPKEPFLGVCGPYAIFANWMHLRQSWISRVVVILLLLWTAADLTASSVCASENQIGNSWSADCVRLDEPPTAAPAHPQIDDCFCCSHSVQIVAVAHVTAPVVSALVVRVLPPRVSFARQLPLDHPPQA